MLTKFFESRFFDILSKIIDVILLGIYWLICCIPVFTIGAATTALYYSINKVIYQGRGYTTEFFHSFKDNFKQATLSWLIFLAVDVVCGLDIYVTRNMMDAGDKMGNMWVFFVIILILSILWTIYHFTYIARFENSFKESFKISGALMILHFPTTILIALITALFAAFAYSMPVFILFIPSIYMVCIRPFFEKIYRKYMSEEDAAREDSYN